MSTNEDIVKVIDISIAVLLGDRVSAQHQKTIREAIEAVHAGTLSVEDAYEQLKFKDGDALDQVAPV